uniref:Major facilitator superfamily (MFS) profile domain-containing protein n=1 Tax=Timema tahoe TaxID=61484 RepID=A0A7R9FK22_9NEOP|nr:unnamed protein product [Timema tahoe]
MHNGNKSKDVRNGSSSVVHVPVYDQGSQDTTYTHQGCIGARHITTFMLFLGMANAYVMRTNMSVAIVAMVNHSALSVSPEIMDDECDREIELEGNKSWVIELANSTKKSYIDSSDGEFVWDAIEQGYLLSSFFYGYVLTQIPFGILAKRYGSKYFLGIGMLINSVFGLLVPISAHWGYGWLLTIRFIQGLGEGPIVPCTHALLAKWIPPNERSRMGAFVYAGAQFGTVISMPLSGLLSEYGFSGGWPSIFYVFGTVGAIWSLLFLVTVYESPDEHPHIADDERKYITSSVWGSAGVSSPPVPWRAILRSMPFWAILVAHMGQNYGYETLMTELPTFMKQVLRFDIKQTRKIVNAIGQYGPAIALIAASYTGCNADLTVALLTIGVGLNGGIYSGFKVNHLDISPRFAGILMSFTNCLANLAGLLAPMTAGYVINERPTQAAWRVVFMISSGVYIVCSTIYLIFGSGVRQPWDDPSHDEPQEDSKDPEKGSVMLQETPR